jgi:hypothetical protein
MLTSIVSSSHRIQSGRFGLTQPDQPWRETTRSRLPLKNDERRSSDRFKLALLTCLTGIVRGIGAGGISCVKLMF